MGHLAHRPATYADLLDLPEHLVGEIINGELHPRRASRHALAATSLGGELDGPFHKGRGGPEAGGSSLSRNCTSVRTCWCPTSPAGGVNACHGFRTRHGSRSRRTGYARFYLPPPHVSIAGKSCPSTQLSASRMSDSSIRSCARSRRSRFTNGKWLLLAAFKNDEAVSIAPFQGMNLGLGVLWVD
jgi:hypothetical protein